MPVWYCHTIFLEHVYLFIFFFFFIFFSFDFFFILYKFLIRKSFQMLLNQTDVAVDEELEKVIKTIYSSTQTSGITNRATSTLRGETTETSSETEACLPLGLRMHTVPNVEI